jgi:hypothetical protein
MRNVKARLVKDGVKRKEERMRCSREHRSRCMRNVEARLVKDGGKR